MTATASRESTTGEWSPVWADHAEIVRYADLTLAEFFRQNARYGGGPGIHEADGLVLFAGPHAQPNPFRNGAFHLDDRLGAEEALDRARTFFAPLKRSYVIWVRESDTELQQLCTTNGMQLVEPDGLPELYLEGKPPAVPELAEGVELKRASNPDVRWDYVRVVADGWGMGGISDELAASIFFHPDSVGDPHVIAYVAYVDGKPASGCMAMLAHGIAVGGQGATVSWARRRGLAEACYAACLETAYGTFGIRGSVCQSSPSGAGVWARMGYQPLTRYLRFIDRPRG